MANILIWVIRFAIIKAAISIGFGIVTYGAVLFAINQAVDHAKVAYNSLPGEALQFLAIAGVPECMGIMLGALVASATLKFAKKLTFTG